MNRNILEKYWPYLRERTAIKITWGIFLFVAAAVLLSPGKVFCAGLEILSPQPGSTIVARHPGTHLVLRKTTTEKQKQVFIMAGNKMIEPIVQMDDEQGYEYLHFRLPLKPELNKFLIMPSRQNFEIRYQVINTTVPNNVDDLYLFHKDEQLPQGCASCHNLQDTKIIEPLGIQGQVSCENCHSDISDVKWQHSPVSNDLCLICHQQSVDPWRIGFPSGSVENICVACHTAQSEWRNRKYIHGPMIAGGCTLCHNPHGSNNRSFLWAKSPLELCVACHDDKDNVLKQNKRLPYIHGLGISCVICHNPHASDNIFILNKPINDLCTGCHYQLEGAKRGHPVERHPLSGPQELRRPGRELTCASCHNPHGSSIAYMLIEDPLGGQICKVCHYKK